MSGALSASFLALCGTNHQGSADSEGVEWVEIVNALAVRRQCEGLASSTKGGVAADLEAEFAWRFFWPIVHAISALGSPSEPHGAAYRALSQTVDRLGVAHLGPVYTRLALPAVACCRPPARSWAAEAQTSIKDFLAGRVGAGTTERCIVYATALLVRRDTFLEMPGEIHVALPRGPPQPIGESPADRARAMLRHVHIPTSDGWLLHRFKEWQ